MNPIAPFARLYRPRRKLFCATRLWSPTGTYVPGATALSGLSHIVIGCPDYQVTDPWLCFPGWWVDPSGPALPEAAAGTDGVVDFATLIVNGVAYPIVAADPRDASGTAVNNGWGFRVPNADSVWARAVNPNGGPVVIPPGAAVAVRTSYTVPSGAPHIGGYTPLSQNGEGGEYTALPQYLKQFSGTVTIQGSVGSGATRVYAPCAMVGERSDTRPVMLVVGDSISVGAGVDNLLYEPRGNASYVTRGLDENAIGQRIAFGHFGVSGTRPSNTTTAVPGDGQFGYRYAAIKKMRDLTGYWPMTHILSQMGVNDATDFATWKGYMDAFWASKAAQFPGVPIWQTTLTPRAQSAGTFYWTDTGQMTFNSVNDGPGLGAARWRMNDYIRSKPSPLAGVVDVAPAFVDPTYQDRWPVPPVHALTTAATTANGATLQVDTAIKRGENIVINPGQAGALRLTVTAVSGSGPYTLTLGTNQNTGATIFPAGTPVAAAETIDGTHPLYSPHGRAAGVLAAAKANF